MPPWPKHPDVDKVAFTGSTETGQKIIRGVGRQRKNALSLELGGKSPKTSFSPTRRWMSAVRGGGPWAAFTQFGPDLQRPGTRLFIERPRLR